MLACLICLTSLEFSTDSAVCISACGHVFHRQCILTCFQLAIEQNRNRTCPKCRQPFGPDQLIKVYLSSIVNLESSDDDDSAEIDNVLKESETCLVKINQMMRQMEGMNREMTQVVSQVKSLSETKKIKKALRRQQRSMVQSEPTQQPADPESTDDYQTRFNLRDLKIVVSPIEFHSDGTVTIR